MSPGSVRKMLPVIFFLIFCAGCSLLTPPENTETPFVQPTLASTPTFPIAASKTHLPTDSPTSVPAPIEKICSPLKGIDLNELRAITSFTFNNPNPFSDDFHPAVDLAFFSFKDFTTIHQHPVQAILPGRVVQVLNDKFPYGNMILIETPLEDIPVLLADHPVIPTPIPHEKIDLSSTCSKEMPAIEWSNDSRSIYTLYAHLDSTPPFKQGDTVTCGQQIGAVGLSGNTVAEHLHLEVRVGPSNARLGTLSMYTANTTTEERYNYCIWSVSGQFQAIDPALFWNQEP